jgi:ABC-2 type transport system ATP-binding protein
VAEGFQRVPAKREPIVTRQAPKPAPRHPASEPQSAESAPPLEPLAPMPPAGAPADDVAIRVQSLRRAYGHKLALDDATFDVRRGEVFGFLGPNGAGKTTTIRILTGLLRASGGEAAIHGARVGPNRTAAKALVGYVPDEPAFPRQLKAMSILRAYARFHGLKHEDAETRGRAVLAAVGLEGRGNDRPRSYSHGMRKRLALAQALLHDPPVLIMDEPASGLDPAGTAWFRETLRSLREQGKTVFLSSHQLHEVEQVCDRIGIIHGGRIRAVDTISNLGSRMRGRFEVTVRADSVPEAALAAVKALPGVLGVRTEQGLVVVEAATDDVAPDVNAALVRHGVRVRALESAQPSLEDIYLAVTRAAEASA